VTSKTWSSITEIFKNKEVEVPILVIDSTCEGGGGSLYSLSYRDLALPSKSLKKKAVQVNADDEILAYCFVPGLTEKREQEWKTFLINVIVNIALTYGRGWGQQTSGPWKLL
jgi:hypothetical protein